MRVDRENGVIIFEHLSQPDNAMVGETVPVKVKVPQFSSSNARGETRKIEGSDELMQLQEVERMGKASGVLFNRLMGAARAN